MVFLAISPRGLSEVLLLAQHCHPVWCGANSVSEEEYRALEGKNLSRFNYELSHSKPEVMAEAVDTIAEHHPGQVIWVEAVPNA